MAEESDNKNTATIASSVFEAAAYERQQLQRRRGFVFLALSALFAGLVVLLMAPPSSSPTLTVFVYGPLVAVTAGVVYGVYRMRKSSWFPVFQPPVSQRERRWRQAFVLAAVALFSLAGPIAMGRVAGAPGERLLAGAFAAMMSLLVVASARSMGDAPMQKVAAASLVLAPLLWLGFLPADQTELVVFAALASGLAAVGVHHATSRKQVAR